MMKTKARRESHGTGRGSMLELDRGGYHSDEMMKTKAGDSPTQQRHEHTPARMHIKRGAWCAVRLLSTPSAKIASMQKHKLRVECIGRVNVGCIGMQTAALNNRYNHLNHQKPQTQEGGIKNKAQAHGQSNKAKEQAHSQDDEAKGEARTTSEQTQQN